MEKKIESRAKIILSIILTVMISLTIQACTQASKVSQNISTEADNFNVIRRLVVINLRSDEILFELVGAFSLSEESSRLVITCETGENDAGEKEYKKHFVSKGEWIFWDIEDISGANVSQYHYEVNFLPKMIKPITFTSND